MSQRDFSQFDFSFLKERKQLSEGGREGGQGNVNSNEFDAIDEPRRC